MLEYNEISLFKVAILQYVAMGKSMYQTTQIKNFQKLNYNPKAIKVVS
jgi:hypothetical protein